MISKLSLESRESGFTLQKKKSYLIYTRFVFKTRLDKLEKSMELHRSCPICFIP